MFTALLGRCLPVLLFGLGACASPTPAPPPPPAGPPPATAPEPPRVVEKLLVMPLRTEAGLELAARSLDEMILTAIHAIKRYEVLGPADLNAVLGVEQLKDAMGCDDVACAAELGGALGAPLLVAGQLGKLGDQAVLSLRLMDTRAPAVLERSTARGGTDAESLSRMMAASVGGLFHVTVAAGEATIVAPPAPATPDYAAYTALMNELGRKAANNEYSQLLDELERVDPKTITVPAGTDLGEILTYYRVTACFMLKRRPCLERFAEAYLRRWPRGMYASAVQGFLDDLERTALLVESKGAEVEAQLATLRDQVRAGNLSEVDAARAGAGLLMSAGRGREAGERLVEIIKRHEQDGALAIELVALAALAFEQAGELEQARQLLVRARARHPRLFKLQGLDAQLRRLPR